jgi:hypothetical protein
MDLAVFRNRRRAVDNRRLVKYGPGTACEADTSTGSSQAYVEYPHMYSRFSIVKGNAASTAADVVQQ